MKTENWVEKLCCKTTDNTVNYMNVVYILSRKSQVTKRKESEKYQGSTDCFNSVQDMKKYKRESYAHKRNFFLQEIDH